MTDKQNQTKELNEFKNLFDGKPTGAEHVWNRVRECEVLAEGADKHPPDVIMSWIDSWIEAVADGIEGEFGHVIAKMMNCPNIAKLFEIIAKLEK